MTLAPSPTRQILLDESAHLTPEPRIHYINHTFSVPENASRIGVIFRFHKEKLAQLFISIYDPQRFRGNRMKPGAKGDVVLELWCSPDASSEGALAGASDPHDDGFHTVMPDWSDPMSHLDTIYCDNTHFVSWENHAANLPTDSLFLARRTSRSGLLANQFQAVYPLRFSLMATSL